jgi:hypothetical protein
MRSEAANGRIFMRRDFRGEILVGAIGTGDGTDR